MTQTSEVLQPAPDAVEGRSTASHVDLLTGACFVLLGVFTLYAGRELAFRSEFGAGPGFLPRVLAVVCIAAGGALAVKQLVRPTQGRAALPPTAGALRVGVTMLLLVIAVNVLDDLGFILTSALLLAGLLLGVERKLTVASGLVIVLVPVAFWSLFAVLLGVRLPPGLVSF